MARTKNPTRQRPLYQPFCRIPDEIRHVAGVARKGEAQPMPSMSFRGQWLRDAGFAPGVRILLRVIERGQLVIDRID
jgi:hypothetical protein